jgi:hypothetical protein
VKFGAIAALSLAGCTSVPQAAVAETGDWGGIHVGLHLTESGGRLEYDCANGTIGPVLVGPGGRFLAEGTHTPGHGGPVREGEVLPTYPAHYSGVVSGSRITLQGRLDSGVVLGPFTLMRGAPPQIFRCL